jgi:subtilisin family serine protease
VTKPPSRRARTSAVLLASALTAAGGFWLTGAGTASAEAASATGSQRPKSIPADTLGWHDMELLGQAKAKGDKNVTLLVATDKGKSQAVAASLKKLGGKVAKQVDKVGYVRVSVPTSNVLQAAKLPGVTAIDLNETIPIPDPRPQSAEGADAGTTADGPGAGTPAANAYMPTNETGAVAFKQAHPEWDGRGVTIGIMDTGIDLDHPALQTTTTGERKIVDWFTATDPLVDGDGTWRAMLTPVTGPTFSFAGGTWTAPAGDWLINRFTEATTDGGNPPEVAGDVNRDGDKTDRFGILYDPVSHDIRVDTNQNLDFTDDAVMRPYNEKFDVGHFGTDNPGTGVREQMPFVVEYREDVDLSPAGLPGQKADFVNIGIVAGAHGSHVAGITAGNDLLGNANLDGAAPGAKLVSARACMFSGGCTAAALLDGMVDLVVNHNVDVVNMSIGGLPALNDANNARARIYDRLINDEGVQMFISAGNSGPGANTVGDPSVASDVVSVAASVSKETWLANYGSVVSKANNLFNFSSRGPREDGGFKPNISAPGSAISSVPTWQAGQPVPEAGYSLPAGYAMFNGTSMAAPQATGAAALLLSAAKANDKNAAPASLRRAIYSTAKPIDGVPVHGQGNGMLDVSGAWNLLANGVTTRGYTVSAPVCTPISGFLATANRGTGVYNRCAAGEGGQVAGEPKPYKVMVTRTSGPAGNIRHNVTWVGNDGSFKSTESVVLPLSRPVQIVVDVKAGGGVHSGIMRIDDPATPAVDHEVLNTVVVSENVAKPDYAFSTSGSVERNSFKSYFVNVPAGAAALQVNLSGIAAGSQTRFIAINPYGVPVESTASTVCYTNFSNPEACKPEERDYQSPLPGVWEFEVESRRTSPALDNAFQLTARVQGVKVEPAVVELPSVTAGQATPATWSLTNQFGPVKVSGQGGPLGSAAVKRPTIANHELITYQVEVPAGATRFDVKIGNTSDLGADLDLYVLRNGTEVGRAADGDSEEAVSLANPPAGTYTVRIDGFDVPSGSTAFDYRDVFYSESLGSISASSATVSLANGGTGFITGSVTASAAPAAGRQLFGELLVVTDEGATVGRGNVSIGAVN